MAREAKVRVKEEQGRQESIAEYEKRQGEIAEKERAREEERQRLIRERDEVY